MLNRIFFWLLCIGIVYGFCKAAYQTKYPPADAAAKVQATESNKEVDVGESVHRARNSIVDNLRSFLGLPAEDRPKPKEYGLQAMGPKLNAALLEAARVSVVDICIPLIGTMALWLGLLNVAKDAGLIDAFARVMRPIMRWLFREVPDGHPAQGAMLMNFSANMLGLDNAATPMGLKAMEELQTLNPVKDTATNSMAQFLAINCGSITLIPFTIISFRYLAGSKDPTCIIGGTLIASTASVIAGITAARILSRRQPVITDTPALDGKEAV